MKHGLLGRRAAYLLLLFAPSALLLRELSGKRFPGVFVYPPHFRVLRFFFHAQEALFAGLIFAVAAWAGAKITNRSARFLVCLAATVWLVWLMFWATIRERFSLEVSPRYAFELLFRPGSITAVGLQPALFYFVLVLGQALMVALAIAAAFLSRQVGQRFVNRTTLIWAVLFAIVHVPVRAYVTSEVNRGQPAVLALDDWTPLALRSEYLIPGLREHRPALPNLEDPAGTRLYIDWAKQPHTDTIPRKLDIVWIVIESFRADAINETATPYLWSHRDEFQLKLDQDHWSGGNATQFGLFSLFFGLSGYHLQSFIRAQVAVPFFDLLARNGYRVRVANRGYFAYQGFDSLLPRSVVTMEVPDGARDVRDRFMVEALLADFEKRSDVPALDIVTFDATHWTFFYPPEDELFLPVMRNLDGTHVTRTPAEVEEVVNRFRNASHFVDRQIGRIMEKLRARAALERTVVIVTGDHGEEFMERGHMYHAGVMNDFQGRPVLWMHLPKATVPASIETGRLTSHVDLVPTLLDVLGFPRDILRSQGESLLHPATKRKGLLLSEQGYYYPFYNALVSPTYISRWRNTPRQFVFSGVERRDGGAVAGDDWLRETRDIYPQAARSYEVVPNPAEAPPPFAQ